MADEIVRTLDYDCARFRLSASPIINIAHRAKKLDEVALRFITRHPDAVALDLGAGLDTRMFRIAPPATVDWYDIDFPEVITARQQLLPDRANAHGIGTDLTDPDWLVAIPTHRPAVIVADGLLAFLPQEDMISLLNRLISHVPSGEVASMATPGLLSGRRSTTTAPSRSRTSSGLPASTTPANPNAGTPD
jgi:O-methyltransferase involved in polyketide biosynthesis